MKCRNPFKRLRRTLHLGGYKADECAPSAAVQRLVLQQTRDRIVSGSVNMLGQEFFQNSKLRRHAFQFACVKICLKSGGTRSARPVLPSLRIVNPHPAIVVGETPQSSLRDIMVAVRDVRFHVALSLCQFLPIATGTPKFLRLLPRSASLHRTLRALLPPILFAPIPREHSRRVRQPFPILRKVQNFHRREIFRRIWCRFSKRGQ